MGDNWVYNRVHCASTLLPAASSASGCQAGMHFAADVFVKQSLTKTEAGQCNTLNCMKSTPNAALVQRCLGLIWFQNSTLDMPEQSAQPANSHRNCTVEPGFRQKYPKTTMLHPAPLHSQGGLQGNDHICYCMHAMVLIQHRRANPPATTPSGP